MFTQHFIALRILFVLITPKKNDISIPSLNPQINIIYRDRDKVLMQVVNFKKLLLFHNQSMYDLCDF